MARSSLDAANGDKAPETTTPTQITAAGTTVTTAPSSSSSSSSTSPPTTTTTDLLKRALSKDNRSHTAKRFFSAYASTWLGLSPLWLMGEALTPGQKVGTRFNKGKAHLVAAAHDVRRAVTDRTEDVVVIVDEKLRGRGGRAQTGRTAEVVKAAGENVLLVVTTSLDKIQTELRRKDYGPELKKVVNKHGRDVIVILDQTLKHPVVITGVRSFGQARGIPHADAMLRLASLGLARILRAMPRPEDSESAMAMAGQNSNSHEGDGLDGVGGARIEEVEEMDAEVLERTSSMEEKEEAREIGRGAGDVPVPVRVEETVAKVPVNGGTSASAGTSGTGNPSATAKDKDKEKDPYEEMRKRTECVVM